MNGKQFFEPCNVIISVHFLFSLVFLSFQADAAVYKVGYPEYLWNDNIFANRYHMVCYNSSLYCCHS